MGMRVWVTVWLATLALFAAPIALAQQNLPPEARAQIIATRIGEAVSAGDVDGALAQMQEMQAQGLPRPPSLLLTEARLSGQVKDYPRALAALEAYFKAAQPSDPSYAEAGRLYIIVERFITQAEQAAKAADDVAWSRATAAGTCAAMIGYYAAAKTPAGYRAEALQRLLVQSCPDLPAVLAPATQAAPVLPEGAAPAPLTMFKDCADCPDMVAIPAGSFVMGSPANEEGRGANEGPQVTVNVSAFALGRFEVTFDDWALCVAGGGCRSNANPSTQGWGGGRRPVINVSWNDAQEYVQWLSAKTGQRYRLLTEAEWEYGTRAGTTGRFSNGGGERELCQIANGLDQSVSWYKEARCSDGIGEQTALVGRYAANPFGVYDVHGNVLEWVEDCYRNSLRGQTASANTAGDCSSRVLRGGSWYFNPIGLRSANRAIRTPSGRNYFRGFRLARTVSPSNR